MMATGLLHHLTVNNGHVAKTPRADVAEISIARLTRLFGDDDCATLPDLGMHIRIIRLRDKSDEPVDGGAGILVSAGDEPAVYCYGCWSPDPAHSRIAWNMLGDIYKPYQKTFASMVGFNKPLPASPPPTPWLGVILTPGVGLFDPPRIMMLGDLERCVFWALAEGSL